MREGYKTVLILLLTASLLFLTSKLWIEFPTKEKAGEVKTTTEFSADQLMNEIVGPEKVIINFSPGEHAVQYDVQNSWSDYVEIIEEAFPMEISHENVEKISFEEYLKLHQKKSIVFQFNNLWNIRFFINLFKLDVHELENIDKIQIEEIYIPLEGSYVVLCGGEDCYQMPVRKKQLEKIETRVNELYSSKQYVPYASFWEIYGIPKSIYIPKEMIRVPKTITYKNQLDKESIEPTFRNDLVERFLGRNIDFILEIVEDTGDIYVNETKSLRIDLEGALEYKDAEEFVTKEANLFLSLETAVNFISSRTGLNNNLVINSIQPIKEDENLGFRIGFNFKENWRPVYLNGREEKDYLSIDVFNTRVKQLKFLYRKSNEETADITFEEKEGYSPKDVLSKNILRFYPEEATEENPISKLLWRVENVNLVYIDDMESGFEKNLIPAWAIDLNNQTHFFSIASGDWIMER